MPDSAWPRREPLGRSAGTGRVQEGLAGWGVGQGLDRLRGPACLAAVGMTYAVVCQAGKPGAPGQPSAGCNLTAVPATAPAGGLVVLCLSSRGPELEAWLVLK